MPIAKIFETSIRHITPEDADILRDLGGYGLGRPPASHPLTTHPYADGFLLQTKAFDDQAIEQALDLGLSSDFVDLIRIAQEAGATTIRLDDNIAPEPGLPVFDAPSPTP